MMSNHRPPQQQPDEILARQILAPLIGDHDDDWTPTRQARVWSAIQVERAAARRAPRWQWPALAALACALAVVIWSSVDHSPAPDQLAPPLTAGDVATGPGRLPSGAQITVEGQVKVVQAQPDRTTLQLTLGAVESRVPPVPTGGAYVVETPEATVHVVGTVFTVRRAGDTTEISVTEGKVRVQPRSGAEAVLLTAGQRHQVKAQGEAAADAPGAPLDPDAVAEAARAAEAAGEWRAAADHLARLSQIAGTEAARQNAAISLGRLLSRHAPAEAAAHWGALLKRWPEGAHVEESMLRHAQALHGAADPAAGQAARRFLDRFPESPFRGQIAPIAAPR